MAAWTLIDSSDLKVLAGTRTLMVSIANGAAVICFIAAGVVRVPEMAAMMISAVIGGYLGAHYSRKIDQRTMRWAVAVIGFVTAGYFFLANSTRHP